MVVLYSFCINRQQQNIALSTQFFSNHISRLLRALYIAVCIAISMFVGAKDCIALDYEASIKSLWSEFKVDISSVQAEIPETLAYITTPRESRIEEQCQAVWWWWKECNLVTVEGYQNNQYENIYSETFTNTHRIEFTIDEIALEDCREPEWLAWLWSWRCYDSDYVEIQIDGNSKRIYADNSYAGERFSFQGNTISVVFYSNGQYTDQGVRLSLVASAQGNKTLVRIKEQLEQAYIESIIDDHSSLEEFIDTLNTIEDMAIGSDIDEQIKSIVAKYKENFLHIIEWLATDTQTKARALSEPQAFVNLAPYIKDESLSHRLDKAQNTQQIKLCLSDVTVDCILAWNEWIQLRNDLGYHFKRHGEDLHNNRHFYYALEAVNKQRADHPQRTYHGPVVGASNPANILPENLPSKIEKRFEQVTTYLSKPATKRVALPLSVEEALALIDVLSFIYQQPGDDFYEKLDATKKIIDDKIFKAFEVVSENYINPMVNSIQTSPLFKLYNYFSTADYAHSDALGLLQSQLIWDHMGLNDQDLHRDKDAYQAVTLDSVNYDAETIAPQYHSDNQRWRIQDKAGDGRGQIDIEFKKATYTVKLFSGDMQTANKPLAIKTYTLDTCLNNPHQYRISSYWSQKTKILSRMTYDCYGSRSVLAAVNRYSLGDNLNKYDVDHPVRTNYNNWQDSLYFNSISYNAIAKVESIIHHKKKGQGQQYTIHPLRYKQKQDKDIELSFDGEGKILSNLLCEENFQYDSLLQRDEVPHCYENILGNRSAYTLDALNKKFWALFGYPVWERVNLFIPPKIGFFESNKQGVIDQNSSLLYPLPVIGIEREAKGVQLIALPKGHSILSDSKADYIDLEMQHAQYVPNYISSFGLEEGGEQALAEHGNDHIFYFRYYHDLLRGMAKSAVTDSYKQGQIIDGKTIMAMAETLIKNQKADKKELEALIPLLQKNLLNSSPYTYAMDNNNDPENMGQAWNAIDGASVEHINKNLYPYNPDAGLLQDNFCSKGGEPVWMLKKGSPTDKEFFDFVKFLLYKSENRDVLIRQTGVAEFLSKLGLEYKEKTQKRKLPAEDWGGNKKQRDWFRQVYMNFDLFALSYAFKNYDHSNGRPNFSGGQSQGLVFADIYSAKSNKPIAKIDPNLLYTSKGFFQEKIGNIGFKFKQIYTLACRDGAGEILLVDHMIELIHTITWQPFAFKDNVFEWRDDSELAVVLSKTFNYYGRLSCLCCTYEGCPAEGEDRCMACAPKSFQIPGWVAYSGIDVATNGNNYQNSLAYVDTLLTGILVPYVPTAISNNLESRFRNARAVPIGALTIWDILIAKLAGKSDAKIAVSAPALKLQVGKKIWGWGKRECRVCNVPRRQNPPANVEMQFQPAVIDMQIQPAQQSIQHSSQRHSIGSSSLLETDRIEIEAMDMDMSTVDRRPSIARRESIRINFEGGEQQLEQRQPNPCSQIWLGNTRFGFYALNAFGNKELTGIGTASDRDKKR
jgi:hypothetical protein